MPNALMPTAKCRIPNALQDRSLPADRIDRQNLALRAEESWRTPIMTTPNSGPRRMLAAVRRWFDLQSKTIWNDLKAELAGATGTVLDVGCGAQPYRCLLPACVEYQGIDTADARANFGYDIPDTVYFAGSTWPVADGNVDCVLVTETMEHVFDTRQFLAEANRCLAPGGRIVGTVPFSVRWHFVPHDFWRFTPSCLKKLLESAGFGDVAVFARGNALTVACYKSMLLILPFLLPVGGSWHGRLLKRILGLCAAPLFLLCGLVGNLSLLHAGSDDCLGYTFTARKYEFTSEPETWVDD
jgi:SAM-dependent methyltransferase